MLKTVALLLPVAFVLSGCGALYEMRQDRFRGECAAYGFEPGSNEMAMCMMVKEENHKTRVLNSSRQTIYVPR